jgi:PKHD-type hydroxylase
MSAFAPSFPVPLGGPLIVWEDAFSSAEVDAIEKLGDALARAKAGLVGTVANPDKRITQVAWMDRNADTAWLYQRLEGIVGRLNSQFYKYELYDSLRERLQYTVYEGAEGGHYDWHVDHGADAPDPRKISISIQLSDPAGYEGCELEISFGDGIRTAPRKRGTAIAFASYVLHRVTPIVSGRRKSLVVWSSGPEFR